MLFVYSLMCTAEVKSLSAERTSLQSELMLTKKLIDGVRGEADAESRGIVSGHACVA